MIANVVNMFDLDFILPISLVDENMKRAHNRNGLLETKFWWKVPNGPDAQTFKVANLTETTFLRSSTAEPDAEAQEEEKKMTCEEMKARDQAQYQELYIWQILLGDESIGFTKGLFPLCQEYMRLKQWDADKVAEITHCLNFLADRAKGEIPTGASFIREFV